MSEYRWRVKKAWIGIKVLAPFILSSGTQMGMTDKLIGVVRRSGVVQACGHFCSVKVSICGKEFLASGAEDRIFPFHSVRLKEGDKVPDLELKALGWCAGGNDFAFKTKDGDSVLIVGAGCEEDNLEPVPADKIPEEWEGA